MADVLVFLLHTHNYPLYVYSLCTDCHLPLLIALIMFLHIVHCTTYVYLFIKLTTVSYIMCTYIYIHIFSYLSFFSLGYTTCLIVQCYSEWKAKEEFHCMGKHGNCAYDRKGSEDHLL